MASRRAGIVLLGEHVVVVFIVPVETRRDQDEVRLERPEPRQQLAWEQ